MKTEQLIKTGQIYYCKRWGSLFQIREIPNKTKKIIIGYPSRYFNDAHTVINQCNKYITRKLLNQCILIDKPENFPSIIYKDDIAWVTKRKQSFFFKYGRKDARGNQ